MVQGQRFRGWRSRTSYKTALKELQRRPEAMTRGDFSTLRQPVGVAGKVENLRRAFDVMGAHVEQGHRTMHDYIATLTTTQESERGRIARELDDDTCALPHSAGARHRMGTARLAPRSGTRRGAFERLRAEVTSLVRTMRGVIADLRSPALDELGLLPTVELLLKHGNGTPDVAITVEGTARRLDEPSELALLRIVQEAWSNIQRHAYASQVAVHFAYTRNAVVVTLGDEGQGFAVPLGMQERASLVGDTLTSTSQAGTGTGVEVRIPYLGLRGTRSRLRHGGWSPGVKG